jgi:hypothetical protein
MADATTPNLGLNMWDTSETFDIDEVNQNSTLIDAFAAGVIKEQDIGGWKCLTLASGYKFASRTSTFTASVNGAYGSWYNGSWSANKPTGFFTSSNVGVFAQPLANGANILSAPSSQNATTISGMFVNALAAANWSITMSFILFGE